ncbi:ATP-dependent DNA ligase [Rubrivirga sp. IMCC43871]|uniref:ATP-dependent DNA ligase n=1 Tax=Rubrivirga sp. IMCC43871 TaxID=3391575 RepID=UPI00398FDE9E
MPTSFHALAETLADIAETSGRHAKADRLGALLADLDDADVRRAARWAAGRVFPLSDQRTVSVGFAALRAATASATGAEPDDLDAALVRLGDPGDVAAGAIAALVPPVAPSLSLADAESFFAHVAATRGSNARTALVAEMLGRLAPVEARFVVKLLAGELRIGMRAGGVESAVARLYGEKVGAVQRANMLTGDIGETAVLARHGRLGEARLRLFHPLTFMLATPAEASDARTLAEEVGRQIAPPVAVEDKFDGIRAQAHIAADPGDPALHGVATGGARVALFSRTLDAITGAFPDVVGPLATLASASPAGLILDGEIVPLDGDGAIVPFQALQRRLGRKTASAELLAEVPVAFIVYDVLAHDGATTLARSYRDRQQLLGGLAFAEPVRRSAVTELDDLDRLDDLFDEARARGNEGLMVKAFDSVYKPGRRGRDWLKVKKALATLDVVVTAVQRGHGGRRKLLSDVTFAVRASETDDTLLNVGKAYSGLTDAELAELTAWFEAHTLETFAHGKVRTVAPEVVLEVAFDNVQVSKRHKGGYALRFPRIVRWRRDKPASEIDTLQTVAALVGDA